MMNIMEKYVDLLLEVISQYGLRLLGALVALIFGLWIIKSLGRLTKKMLHKRKVDESLMHFFHSLFII